MIRTIALIAFGIAAGSAATIAITSRSELAPPASAAANEPKPAALAAIEREHPNFRLVRHWRIENRTAATFAARADLGRAVGEIEGKPLVLRTHAADGEITILLDDQNQPLTRLPEDKPLPAGGVVIGTMEHRELLARQEQRFRQTMEAGHAAAAEVRERESEAATKKLREEAEAQAAAMRRMLVDEVGRFAGKRALMTVTAGERRQQSQVKVGIDGDMVVIETAQGAQRLAMKLPFLTGSLDGCAASLQFAPSREDRRGAVTTRMAASFVGQIACQNDRRQVVIALAEPSKS